MMGFRMQNIEPAWVTLADGGRRNNIMSGTDRQRDKDNNFITKQLMITLKTFPFH